MSNSQQLLIKDPTFPRLKDRKCCPKYNPFKSYIQILVAEKEKREDYKIIINNIHKRPGKAMARRIKLCNS